MSMKSTRIVLILPLWPFSNLFAAGTCSRKSCMLFIAMQPAACMATLSAACVFKSRVLAPVIKKRLKEQLSVLRRHGMSRFLRLSRIHVRSRASDGQGNEICAM
ncbi:hypothetical protein CPB84DRAFT_1788783 [Gymnopilus junonius]|uniref:Secreted protein n=1 Tax=Gymnopilus junonius TaxID=109634 RepID=A0A9P5NG99_GYMJU|nr:hypothetical protein CPB84DRAFT_1788783 [Gymnopilus junonius]